MNSQPLLLSSASGRGKGRDSEIPPSMRASTDSMKSRSMGVQDRSITEGVLQASPDLRSVVASRFMRMLQTHDRARLETLAGYQSQIRL